MFPVWCHQHVVVDVILVANRHGVVGVSGDTLVTRQATALWSVVTAIIVQLCGSEVHVCGDTHTLVTVTPQAALWSVTVCIVLLHDSLSPW